MDCAVEIARELHTPSATMTANRLDSLSLQSHLAFISANIVTGEGITPRIIEIRSNSKLIEIPRGCAVEARLGPSPEYHEYGSVKGFEFAAKSLAKMQIWEDTNDTALYHESKKLEQPSKIQTICTALDPDKDQANVDVKESTNEYTQLESKVKETVRLQSCLDFAATNVVLPEQKTDKCIVVRPNSPTSGFESSGNAMYLTSLDRTKGWEPDRSQRLKRKYYEWAATQAAIRRPRSISNRADSANYGDRSNGRRPGRPPAVPAQIPMYLPDPTSQNFDQCATNVYVPTFVPLPGDIIFSYACREMQQNNPYFNPGGHCRLYTDPEWLDRGRYMRDRAVREDNQLQTHIQFEPGNFIIRAGKIDHAYHFIPQTNVELFTYMGVGHPWPWLLHSRVPFQRLQPPITHATGTPENRTVHEFQPPGTRVFGQLLGGFGPRQGDLIVGETEGFSELRISYYHHQRTQLVPHSLLVRPGYGRVEDSLVATVEMYQYIRNPTSQEMGWIFQGRDIQIYGGTQTLDSLIQVTEPHALGGPEAQFMSEDIALADSYLNH